MKRLIIFLTATFCALTSLGQTAPRFELLTRSATPLTRRGGNAVSGAPEISRDGAFVLFVSLAANLTTNQDTRVANLYMVNRQTHAVTLISAGTNGAPANDSIEDYQFSADGRKIVFESRASNLVANDTNNRADIFVRDLDLNQTILVSVDTNGLPAGGTGPRISGDGNYVGFTSPSASISASDRNSSDDAFVRDLVGNQTRLVSVGPDGLNSQFEGSVFSEISDDGRIVIFEGPNSLIQVQQSFPALVTYVRDLEMQTTRRPYAVGNTVVYRSLLSPDGQWLLLGAGSFSGQGNMLGRFNIATSAMELMETNNSSLSNYFPIAISADTSVKIVQRGSIVMLYRDGLPSERFMPIQYLNLQASSIDLSPDGKFATFSAATNVSPQAFIRNIETGEVKKLSPFNDDNGVSDLPANAVLDATANYAAYVAESDPLTEASKPVANIYFWNRATEQSELLSSAAAGSAQTTGVRGSAHSKRFCVSDDGRRVVYQSLEAVDERTKTNPIWNVFLLDRSTGQKQLISRSVDGLGGGNKASYGAVISGNGSSVAYFTKATNLIDTPQTGANAISITVKDLNSGAVYLANRPTNSNIFTTRADSLSWSRDGKYLIFSADSLAAGSFTGMNIYLFSLVENNWTLITYRSDGRPFQSSITGPFNSVISPDGNYIAFQTLSGSDAGFTGSGLQTFICGRAGRPYERISSFPGASSGTSGNARSLLRFTADSSAIVFGGWTNGVSQYYNLATQTVSNAATNCIDADISDDLRWCAFTRVETVSPTFTRNHIFLRNLATGEETFITTNGNFHSYNPRLTADGRFVIFESRATNLVTNDFNNMPDIFLYDRTRRRLELVSQNSAGGAGNSASQRPVLSGDSSTIVFKTHASDLVDGDFNEAPDLLAYTLPNLKITSYEVVGGKLRLVWDASPGQTYRIQSRESLTSGDWGDEPSISGQVEVPASGARFYRVLQDQ
jgi:Tol biopolymer transport system component